METNPKNNDHQKPASAGDIDRAVSEAAAWGQASIGEVVLAWHKGDTKRTCVNEEWAALLEPLRQRLADQHSRDANEGNE